MPSTMRAFVGAAVLLLAGLGSARAQASPYLPVDDSRLPLLEHLIARGDVEDPSPMVRPFRFADALRVLGAADTAPETRSGRLVHTLRESLTADVGSESAWWRAEVRGGGEAYTQKRRDPLHLGGPGTENPYLDFALRAGFGPVVGVVRASVEPSLIGNPDWPNRAQENVTGRLIEGYLSGQFRYGALTYGQLLHNWGPVGLPGIPLSDVAFERQGLELELGTRTLRLRALASDLRPQRDSLGESVNRYYFVHRLEAQLTRRLRLALWESVLIQGVGRTLETPFANPLSPTVLANDFGIADTGSNTMIGVDASWRAGRKVTLQLQAAIDDFWFNKRNQKQDRWAFTLAGYGPLGSRLGWRAWYTQVSSLALRTANPQENFTDQGVGIGRNFSDDDQLSASVTIPALRSWLLTPELTFQRQGEGKIDDPYPRLDANGNQITPMFLIGTVEHTYRVALGVSGREGPLDLSANAGFHHVTNDQNQPGVTANRFVARIKATLAWRRGGVLR
jgi:hypothetical protein